MHAANAFLLLKTRGSWANEAPAHLPNMRIARITGVLTISHSLESLGIGRASIQNKCAFTGGSFPGRRLERENIHDQIRFAIQQNDMAAD